MSSRHIPGIQFGTCEEGYTIGGGDNCVALVLAKDTSRSLIRLDAADAMAFAELIGGAAVHHSECSECSLKQVWAVLGLAPGSNGVVFWDDAKLQINPRRGEPRSLGDRLIARADDRVHLAGLRQTNR